LAQPGGVCISGAVKDQLSAKMDLAFEPLGTQSLKNIRDPIAVYRLSPRPNEKPQSRRRDFHQDLRIPTKPSIAVLPFQNMSKEDEQEFFADGLTEDIITKLSYLRGLLVISRTSTFAYKGRAVHLNDVARDLGVRYILEGSVRKFETRVRITAQLIDASSGAHLWSQKYDRELD
jgi:adenylate cyclase